MGTKKDLKDQIFGELTVIKEFPRSSDVNSHKWKTKWVCKCSCGQEYITTSNSLTTGKIKMCKVCSRKIATEKRIPDLVGKTYGELTVIRRATKEEKPSGVFWLCKCSCGNESFVTTGNLNNGHVTSCWKCGHNKSGKHKRIDLVGQRFGKLVVLEMIYPNREISDTVYCKCQCDCGNISMVSQGGLRSKGKTQSCGCLRKEIISNKLRKSVVGQRFCSLTVIDEYYYQDVTKQPELKCLCDCGNIKILSKRDVCSGHTTSCGCMRTSSLERNVELILKDLNCNYKKEYRFDDCKYIDKLKFDFVIFDNENHIVQIIETDGEQHYKPNEFFGGEEAFKTTQIRDNIKNEYCKTHNIPLLRLPYYLNKEEMENEIKKVI